MNRLTWIICTSLSNPVHIYLKLNSLHQGFIMINTDPAIFILKWMPLQISLKWLP